MQDLVEDLLHPLTVLQYAGSYFEVQPALLRRPLSSQAYFAPLLPLRELDSIAQGALESTTDWNLVQKTWVGDRWTTEGVVNREEEKTRNMTLDRLKRHVFQGSLTLVVNKVQRYSNSVKVATEAFSQALGHHVSANLYLSSMMSSQSRQGFAPHFDWMDSIIVQVTGCKRWRIYDNLWPSTLLPSPDTVFEITKNTSALEELPIAAEFELTAGSVVTIPRGWVHEAATNCSAETVAKLSSPEVSLHLTFGIEAAILTTMEILLHHLIALDGGGNNAAAHMLLHRAAIRHEAEAVVLRKALPRSLLVGTIAPALSKGDEELVRAAAASALRLASAREGEVEDSCPSPPLIPPHLEPFFSAADATICSTAAKGRGNALAAALAPARLSLERVQTALSMLWVSREI